MKKFLCAVVILCALACVRCFTSVESHPPVEQPDGLAIVQIKPMEPRFVPSSVYLKTGEWNGHHYLFFYYDRGMGVVHDPDCPCYSKTYDD